MLKKILYSVAAIVMGFLFMMAFFMTTIQNKQKSLCNRAIKNNDYSYILTSYDDLSNKKAIYSQKVGEEAIVSIFETANYKKVEKDGESYDILDATYSIIIANDTRYYKDTQINSSLANKTGFKMTVNGVDIEYFDNGYRDGIKDETYENYQSEIYGSYNEIAAGYSAVSLYEYQISYDFIKYMLGDNVTDINITSITLVDSKGNDYGSSMNFDTPLSFNSQMHKLVFDFKQKCIDHSNDIITLSDKEDYYVNEWKPKFLEIDGCTILKEKDYYYTPSLYVKMIAIAVAYIIIMYCIGDTLVGKQRIINLFRSLTSGRNNNSNNNVYKRNKKDDVINVETRVINDDVKKEDK